MDSNRPYRPRVSRETRLLLTTALVAVAALWVLARLRFPDLPATPNPVSPLLSQLTPPLTFEGLASEIAQLQARLEPSLIALDSRTFDVRSGVGNRSRVTALRVRDDLALTVVQDAHARDVGRTDRVLGIDPASGLGAVRVPAESPASPPVVWAPRRLERPQFFVVTDASSDRVSLRPVFISILEPIANALWAEPIWAFSHQTDILPGSFLFTIAGEFVGIVIDYPGRRAVVPPGIALAEVERLAKSVTAPAGDLGISAQSLSPDLSAATGATVGVVVNWVDARGPAADVVAIGDVIEAADGQTLSTFEHWRVRLARLGAGDALTLRVRRRAEVRDVQLLAPAPDNPVAQHASLGLRMRPASGAGAEILGIEPNSASARAGLAAGDVITFIGGISSPTPTQVRTVFGAAPGGKPTLVGVTRGPTHLVTTLTR
jgi:hypothetical protein